MMMIRPERSTRFNPSTKHHNGYEQRANKLPQFALLHHTFRQYILKIYTQEDHMEDKKPNSSGEQAIEIFPSPEYKDS